MSPQIGAPLCVFCRRAPADDRWRPFCSERCKMQDLARWAGGDYRIPGEAAGAPEDEDSHQEKRRD